MSSKQKSSRAPSGSSPTVLVDETAFQAAVSALTSLDADFTAALRLAGAAPRLRRREAGFEGLASIIVAQQVSTASANAIFGRFKAQFGGALEAASVLAASETDLKLCGLSAPKIRTLRAIAEAVDAGTLDFAALATMEAEKAHQALIAVKGIGPWTADVFLLFCLGHADAWPAGDLALQEAARLALALPNRPTMKEMVALGERWRPLRGVAAHCLWAYYHVARGRAATLEATVPVKTKAPKTEAPKKAEAAEANRRRSAKRRGRARQAT